MPTFPSSPIPTKTILLLVYVRYYSSRDYHSWVGTCIQRQLNVPVLICREHTSRAACTNELLDLCVTFVNEQPSINQLKTTNHLVSLCHAVYTQQYNTSCRKHNTTQAAKEML